MPQALSSICLFCATRPLYRQAAAAASLPPSFRRPVLENVDIRERFIRSRGGEEVRYDGDLFASRGRPKQPYHFQKVPVRKPNARGGRGPYAPSKQHNGPHKHRSIEEKASSEPMEVVAVSILENIKDSMHSNSFRLLTNLSPGEAQERFEEFEKAILKALESAPSKVFAKSMRESLLLEYKDRGREGLNSRMKYLFQAQIANKKFLQSDIVNQIKLTDLRWPNEWYPSARRMRRVIHLHIGPTNSGKTYHALQRLEQAESGCYAGPLRLLAHEVYTRLNAKGKACSLITGDEIIIAEGDDQKKLSSCTVEMVPFGVELDVAVIDEIQMISDSYRGWAWTQALLGLRAKEIHLCGETRSLRLIQEIAASLDEELVIHNYERLSPLAVANEGLSGDLRNLQKGDCIVSFSKQILHSLKKAIQSITGRQVAIVYGALPPEIRAQQANLFNEQDNDYDILVASDAVGMGLNLSVKRIIFETLEKYDGSDVVSVSVPAIKQIGGRAGRYRTATQDNAQAEQLRSVKNALRSIVPTNQASNTGYVTTLHNSDLPRLRRAMSTEPEALKSAYIKPPDDLIIRFCSYFPPGTALSYILLRICEIARRHPRYTLSDLRDQVRIADAIQVVEGLTISQRLMFLYSPADVRKPMIAKVLVAMAECVATRDGKGGLLDISEIDLEVLDQPESSNQAYIAQLALTHQALVLYLWLSYRMPNIFHSQALAFYTKGLLQEKLDKALLTGRQVTKKVLEQRHRAFEKARIRNEGPDPELKIDEDANVDDKDSAALAQELDSAGMEECLETEDVEDKHVPLPAHIPVVDIEHKDGVGKTL